MPDTSLDKATLRAELRRRRQALSMPEQQAAAQAVADSVRRLPNWQSASSLAVYLAADGEIDAAPVANFARADGKSVYLPVICEDNSLVFALWEPGARLSPNRYGIPEPPSLATVCEPTKLDLIFLPLVGWDRAGGRLGMGGGFYDRTLEKVAGPLTGPLLVGLAHGCQEMQRMPMDSWDIRLDYVATEATLLYCKG
jgi:5-formyltetrahydrofolate cyclo-ligase